MATVLLDLYGVVLDGSRLREPYRHLMATKLRDGFGGTYEDWLRGYDAGWAAYDRLAEAPTSMGSVRERYRAMDRAHLRTVFEVAGVPPPDDEALIGLSRRLGREILRAAADAYPDVPKALEAMRRAGHVLYLSTNANDDAAEASLEGMGIRDAFAALFTVDSQDATKRDPRYWEGVARHLGTAAADWTVVDDRAEYLRTPSALGATCVLLDRSGSAPVDSPVPVAATLRHLAALPPFLASRGR